MSTRRGRAQANKRNITAKDGTGSERSITQYEARAEYYEGVLPHPDELAKYEALHPGIIGWMMNRVEKQQDHRMAMEIKALDSHTKLAYKGQAFALSLGLGTLIVAGIGFALAQPLAGFGAVVVGLGSIGSAYIHGLKQEAKERQEKDKALHGPVERPQLPPTTKPST